MRSIAYSRPWNPPAGDGTAINWYLLIRCVGYPPGVTPQPDSAGEVERQFAEIAAVLRGRWVPPDVGGPRVLTGPVYDEARLFIVRTAAPVTPVH